MEETEIKRRIEMPRIQAIDPATAEPKAKKLLEGVQQKMGMVPNIMRTLAHSPAALESLLGFKGALAKGKLPRSCASRWPSRSGS
jgi:hypothetical protein